MNAQRLQALYEYILARANGAEDYRERDLGPIHLLKYAYLADVEWAKRHPESWTGVQWMFHHFGPWSVQAWEQIATTMKTIGATVRVVEHSKADDDGIRYRSQDVEPDSRLAREIPAEIRLSINQAVKRHGNDLAQLLHTVYVTPPMVHAAPGEPLDLKHSWREPQTRQALATPEPKTAKQRKRETERRRAFSEDIRARLAERNAARVHQGRVPRYDDIFRSGTDWLNGQDAVNVSGAGTVRVGADIWKSETRADQDVD